MPLDVAGYNLVIANTVDGSGDGCYDVSDNFYNHLQFTISSFDDCADQTEACPGPCASNSVCGQFDSTAGYVGFRYQASAVEFYCNCLFEGTVTDDPLNDSNVLWTVNGPPDATGPISHELIPDGMPAVDVYCYSVSLFSFHHQHENTVDS